MKWIKKLQQVWYICFYFTQYPMIYLIMTLFKFGFSRIWYVFIRIFTEPRQSAFIFVSNRYLLCPIPTLNENGKTYMVSRISVCMQFICNCNCRWIWSMKNSKFVISHNSIPLVARHLHAINMKGHGRLKFIQWIRHKYFTF